MTGPEHYTQAEQLLMLANIKPDNFPSDAFAQTIAEAQVHATLSLAAATALGNEGEGRTQPSKDRTAWFQAASECKKQAEVTTDDALNLYARAIEGL